MVLGRTNHATRHMLFNSVTVFFVVGVVGGLNIAGGTDLDFNGTIHVEDIVKIVVAVTDCCDRTEDKTNVFFGDTGIFTGDVALARVAHVLLEKTD